MARCWCPMTWLAPSIASPTRSNLIHPTPTALSSGQRGFFDSGTRMKSFDRNAVRRGLIAFAALALMAAPAASAADAAAGLKKAGACFECHGADGNSANPIYPSLAAQTPLYIYYQL